MPAMKRRLRPNRSATRPKNRVNPAAHSAKDVAILCQKRGPLRPCRLTCGTARRLSALVSDETLTFTAGPQQQSALWRCRPPDGAHLHPGQELFALWRRYLLGPLDLRAACRARQPANFVPVNNADNWLHLVLGIGMIALALILSRDTARPHPPAREAQRTTKGGRRAPGWRLLSLSHWHGQTRPPDRSRNHPRRRPRGRSALLWTTGGSDAYIMKRKGMPPVMV
jgi:hypothetical protein